MTNWFRFIAEPMARALVFLAQNAFGAGIAIILFTLAVKLVLLPLTLQQLRSAKRMQELQPEIQELQRKHKGDKQKLTEETMALYKERKINPAAGCFPLLIQMPVLLGMYGALLALGNTTDPLYSPLFTQPFLWLPSLAHPDPFHILPVFCVVSQWVQQRMMMGQKNSDPQQAAMQSMMQFMPLMIGFISWNYAAGLPLYWAVSTLFAIVQQYFITGWGSLKTLGQGGFGLSSLSGLLSGPKDSGDATSNSGRSASGRAANGRSPRATTGPARAKRTTTEGPRPGGGKRTNGKR